MITIVCTCRHKFT